MSISNASVQMLETSTSFFEKTANGIVIVRKKKNSFVDLDAAKEDFKAHMKISEEKKSPVLLVMTEMLNASAEAREFFSLDIHEKYRSAEAYVISTLGIRILVTFYMKTVKKPYPIKIFSKENEAILWLEKYL